MDGNGRGMPGCPRPCVIPDEPAQGHQEPGSFPDDDAIVKLFFLALRNIAKQWIMPIREWKMENTSGGKSS
ncbi:MAG: hypothetical protein ACYC7I_00240 [Gammaproteobacteria bacterium]